MELIGGWVALAALLGHFSEFEPRPSARIRWSLFLIPVVWILLITQVYALPPVSQQTGMQSASVVFESGGKLHAFSLKRNNSSASINLYVSFSPADFKSQGYSVHLIDPISHESIAGADKVMINHLRFRMGPGFTPTHLQYVKLRIPSDAPAQSCALGCPVSLARGRRRLPGAKDSIKRPSTTWRHANHSWRTRASGRVFPTPAICSARLL